MITKLLDKKNIDSIKKACLLIVNRQVTIENIDDILCTLLYFEYEVMNDVEIHENVIYLLKNHIDDIQEIESLSPENKNQLIINSINQDLNLLEKRAADILHKIGSDQKEAIESGYCLELMKK